MRRLGAHGGQRAVPEIAVDEDRAAGAHAEPQLRGGGRGVDGPVADALVAVATVEHLVLHRVSW